MGDFTYRSQQVDYLGFLEAQLRDLQGVDRLAYELIQNADDVRAEDGGARPTRLVFDVTDDALIVANDGVFRPLDFERLQRIAGGGKRDEPDTTGAFGLGFIAVYQITDAPEIFSSDLHWVIHPEAPPDRRIEERPVQTAGTRFVLPWAFDAASTVRRALRIEAVDPANLEAIAAELAAAIGRAALFLTQLRLLEVRRRGALLRGIERTVTAAGRLTLREANREAASWLLFEDNFSAEAGRLRERYAAQIEDKRHSEVTLAVSTTTLPAQGRLYAVLPTDVTMPLPLHLNADFYPTTDRRRVHFDGGYQARWNEQALTCAAGLLARRIGDVRDALSPTTLWRLLQGAQETQRLAESGDLPAPFGAFWRALAPRLRDEATVYTVRGDWLPPSRVRLAPPGADADLLQALNIPVAHPQLDPYISLMRSPDVGVPALSPADLREGLRGHLTRRTPLDQAPPFLRSLDAWRALWRLVDDLLDGLPRHKQRDAVMEHLGDLPLVLDDRMILRPVRRIYRGNEQAQALFPDVAWIHPDLDPDTSPGRFVTPFGARQAVDHLALQTQEQLEEAWRMGRLDVPRLFRWFESQQIEILADDPSLQREIRNLPLCPVEGELRPLAHLYIPGGFEDPLQLAGVVDMEAIGGRRQFLRDLGLQELDFETYVHTHLPRVLAQDPDLPSDARHRLLQLLAQRLGQIRDDAELREQLSSLPLVPCMDGAFRPGRDVYASRQVVTLVGPRAHIAEPAEGESLAALYSWLGVRREPTAADLVQRLQDLSAEQISSGKPLPDEGLETVLENWQRLDALFERGKLPEDLPAQLRERRTLPNRRRAMREPGRLLFVDDPTLPDRFGAPDALEGHLLLIDAPLPALMEVAGVRRLSEAVDLEVAGERPGTAARDLEQRLRERLPLIARLLHEPGDGSRETGAADGDPLGVLRNLHIVHLPGLQRSYRLALEDETFATEGEAQPAVYVAAQKTLYVEGSGQASRLDARVWAAIARELALAVVSARPTQNGSPAGLALGIREVLAAATYDDAANILDELGYP